MLHGPAVHTTCQPTTRAAWRGQDLPTYLVELLWSRLLLPPLYITAAWVGIVALMRMGQPAHHTRMGRIHKVIIQPDPHYVRPLHPPDAWGLAAS